MGSSKDPPVGLPDTDDPYVLLDVRPGASADQIRRAYLRRVKVYKPDRYPAEFRRVREAYDRLREQEAWFDAWRQASEVVKQAQEAQKRQAEGTAESGSNADTDPAPKAGSDADTDPAPKTGSDANTDPALDGGGVEAEVPPPSFVDTDVMPPLGAQGTGAAASPPSFVDTDVMEPSDEALKAEERAQAEEDEDDVSLEQIMAELDDELQANRRPPPVASGWIEVGEPRPEPETPPRVVLGLYMEDATMDLPHLDPARQTVEVSPPVGRPEATPNGLPERLDALVEAVHEGLLAERYADVTARLLDRETLALATQPGFSSLLLEACCALVWAAPKGFVELSARYSDIIAGQDTEYRDGALLHRRTLAEELPAWREAVAQWPELDRFVMLGSSLRPPAEAELGLVLGQRAAEDSAGFLEVICRATARAPGVAALYVGMAERWSKRFGELPAGAPARTRPTVQQAAEALAERAQRDRWVRWEQLRPLIVVLVMGAILVLSSSRVIELVVIGVVLGLWAWRAWAATPEERIYVKVLRPSAASWLWATQASVDELAVAFEGRLPERGSWAAVLHPGDLTEYPQYLGNDLALLAFAVTAPMIPRLGKRRG